MTEKELNKILKLHDKWLRHEQGGKCADLSYSNLSYFNLEYDKLQSVNLANAKLANADLHNADLHGANLKNTYLGHANLQYANLDAELCHANLEYANLKYAKLRYANLKGANLEYANLDGAELSEKEQIRKGFIVKHKLIGWKKCCYGILVKLEIPKGAIVFSINNYKCRTNIAKVVKIVGGNGKTAISQYDRDFIYKLGKTIVIDDFNCIYNVECATGIHFFRTLKEAKEYY